MRGKHGENVSKHDGVGETEMAPGSTLHPLVDTAPHEYPKRCCICAQPDILQPVLHLSDTPSLEGEAQERLLRQLLRKKAYEAGEGSRKEVL